MIAKKKKSKKKPAKKKQSKPTTLEVKMTLWAHATVRGFTISSTGNCAFSVASDGRQIRYNFNDDKVLKLDVKRPPTVEEKKLTPGRSGYKWENLQKCPYEKVKIDSDGNLDLSENKAE